MPCHDFLYILNFPPLASRSIIFGKTNLIDDLNKSSTTYSRILHLLPEREKPYEYFINKICKINKIKDAEPKVKMNIKNVKSIAKNGSFFCKNGKINGA